MLELSGDTLQDYLVVRHNTASVAKFDVRLAVEEWMTRRDRRPRQDRDIQKFMRQEYISSFLEFIQNNLIKLYLL